MAIKIIGQHPYGTDGNIWQVSLEAHIERRAAHVEIPDVADGYAYVDHQDWHDLYDALMASHPPEHDYKDPVDYGPFYLVHAVDPDGKIAHIGGIHQRDGRINLSG